MNARVEFHENFASNDAPWAGVSRGGRKPLPFVHLVVSSQSLRMLLGAGLGAAAAIAVLALVTLLPETQHLSGLAALAAGMGMPMAMHSLSDSLIGRGLLRGAAALSAGFVAYQALSFGWGMLGLAWTILFAWAVTDWIHRGASIHKTVLLSGLLVMAGSAFVQI